MAYRQIILLFGVGTLAGFINVMAGGGSTITLPTLIFLGLDSALANGTNRLAIFIQNIFAIISFRRQKVHQFRESFLLSLYTLPGSIIGAIVAVRIGNELFKKILACVIIAILISIFFSNSYKKPQKGRVVGMRKYFLYPALFAIGFYGGFIQAGVGFLLIASLYHLQNINLLYVNMHKVFIIFIYTIPALIIFIMTGNINWIFGLSLACGSSFGAWWSARFAVSGGERMIRIVLTIAIIIISLKLFNVF